MSTPDAPTSAFDIINHTPAPAGEHSWYRVLVNNSSTIKYLAAPGTDPPTKHQDILGLDLDFNRVPEGDWNVAFLTPFDSPVGVKYSLKSLEKKVLAAVYKKWCDRTVDCSELGDPIPNHEFGSNLKRGGPTSSVVFPSPFGDIGHVVVNSQWNPDDVDCVSHETDIYQSFQKQHIGPHFLAHLTENHDRVIGYIVMTYPDHKVESLNELKECQKILSSLHELGIAKGLIRLEDFLLTDYAYVAYREEAVSGCFARMQNFEQSYRTDDQKVFEGEMEQMKVFIRQAEKGQGLLGALRRILPRSTSEPDQNQLHLQTKIRNFRQQQRLLQGPFRR